MLALCSIPSYTNYAQYYAGILAGPQPKCHLHCPFITLVYLINKINVVD